MSAPYSVNPVIQGPETGSGAQSLITSDVQRPISLSSPIETKIAWARHQYQVFGEVILRDRKLAGLLADLKEAVETSRREMAKTGIVEICRRCDQEEGGSCCGAGIENRYDGWLLLINLLLGVALPDERRRSDSCFFAGENGCLLMARHILCINYLCRNVTDRIDPGTIAPLREKEGAEVNALFLLHERIKTVMKPWT